MGVTPILGAVLTKSCFLYFLYRQKLFCVTLGNVLSSCQLSIILKSIFLSKNVLLNFLTIPNLMAAPRVWWRDLCCFVKSRNISGIPNTTSPSICSLQTSLQTFKLLNVDQSFQELRATHTLPIDILQSEIDCKMCFPIFPLIYLLSAVWGWRRYYDT